MVGTSELGAVGKTFAAKKDNHFSQAKNRSSPHLLIYIPFIFRFENLMFHQFTQCPLISPIARKLGLSQNWSCPTPSLLLSICCSRPNFRVKRVFARTRHIALRSHGNACYAVYPLADDFRYKCCKIHVDLSLSDDNLVL